MSILLSSSSLVALAGGVAAVVLALRTHAGRLLLSYLAVANIAFVAMFLFASPTAKLIAGGGSGDLGDVTVPEPAGPVVVIVLDEFPAATIMRPDGTINSDRFPGFAELASVSTWFRNASSQHNLTHRAVPSILDGRLVRGRRRCRPTATTRATCSRCSVGRSPCTATNR